MQTLKRHNPETPPKKKPPATAALCWEAGAPPPDLDEAVIQTALGNFLAVVGHEGAEISVLLADDARLRELNLAHRGLDRPTDVLSWSYAGELGKESLLGEIAVSLERARHQAADNGWEAATELMRLLAHGCAHLAGYDHQDAKGEREMMAVEVNMLALVGLEGLYPDFRPAL